MAFSNMLRRDAITAGLSAFSLMGNNLAVYYYVYFLHVTSRIRLSVQATRVELPDRVFALRICKPVSLSVIILTSSSYSNSVR